MALNQALNYYAWIFNRIVILDDDLAVRAFLNTVRQQLLDGNIHDHLLLQEEIDQAEYKDWLKKTT